MILGPGFHIFSVSFKTLFGKQMERAQRFCIVLVVVSWFVNYRTGVFVIMTLTVTRPPLLVITSGANTRMEEVRSQQERSTATAALPQ